MRIGTKFTLLVLSLLTLTLGLASVYLLVEERRAALAQLQAKSNAQGRLLALIAPDAIIGYDFILLNDYVEQITHDPDVAFAAVFGRNGAPITSFLDVQDPMIRKVLAQQQMAGVREVRAALTDIPGVFVDRMAILSDGRLLGELVIATDMRRIDRELALLLAKQASLYLLIIGVLGAAIVAIFRFNVLRPVQALMRGARRVSSGDYAQSVEVLGNDELGSLTKAFNAMMSQIKEEREQLFVQANYDALTGLPNRKMAMERILHEIDRARRESSSFAILFIDLDNFKYVNDTMGHAVGDKLLVEIGTRFRAQLRAVDLLARLGGDEYLVLMPQTTSPETVHAAAERLLEAASKPARIDESDVYIRCSVGVAFFPDDGDNAETLMAAADSAMYSAKHNSVSSVQFYTRAMNEAARRRVEFERDIYAALASDEFFLVFQPVVRVSDSAYVGAEALLRWKHPQKGLLTPNDFISIAEQTGQIDAIGDWVLAQACKSAAALVDSGLPKGFIAINVSSHQLKRGFETRVADALRDYGLPGDQIVLEITESALMADTQELLEMFDFWRDARIKLSLDDFGTGFSSLSYLSRFSFDTIKIDKSFVDGLPNNRESWSLVAAIIAIANNLGMESVAEGVENESQRLALLDLGCDNFQGFLYRRPMPLADLKVYLSSSARIARHDMGAAKARR
jgi:diguanylate cyclase (GGDEF)-like protein